MLNTVRLPGLDEPSGGQQQSPDGRPKTPGTPNIMEGLKSLGEREQAAEKRLEQAEQRRLSTPQLLEEADHPRAGELGNTVRVRVFAH